MCKSRPVGVFSDVRVTHMTEQYHHDGTISHRARYTRRTVKTFLHLIFDPSSSPERKGTREGRGNKCCLSAPCRC